MTVDVLKEIGIRRKHPLDDTCNSLREQARELEKAIRGRTIGGDVCLEPGEVRALVTLLKGTADELKAHLNAINCTELQP